MYCIAIRRAKPQTYVTYTENLVKCGRMVFEICKQTDMPITMLRTPTEAK